MLMRYIIFRGYLTIDNPLFNQRVELGLGNWNVPSKLVYYEYDYDLQQITVPVGALPDLIGKKHNIT
jgi:hypothetical protein